MNKSSTGLDENVAGLLCYVLGWVTGIVFIIIERENNFVRFHAVQSIVVFGVLTVASAVLGWIPILGTIVNIVLSVLSLVLWILLMVKAFQGEYYKLRWSGDIAAKWVGLDK